MTTPTLPPQMQHITTNGYGDANVLTLTQSPIPTPQANEVLIRVAAAGINRPDILQRQGLYPPPTGASPILGLEIAGTIVAVGEGVAPAEIGKTVCALVTGGGYAEYCTAAHPLCLPIPTGFTLQQAAALPETFFTVWTNLFERAALQAGETLLIHGGSSGIGTTAIQLAKAFGATVFTTVGNAEKAHICKTLGADLVINYRTQDFVAIIKTHTEKRGVNVILDMVGGDYIPQNISILATEGRLVQIAFLQGSKAQLDFMTVMLKRLTITGSTLRARTVAQKAQIAQALREKVWHLLENGTIKPVIDRTYPLAQAAAAHQYMESSQHIGKLVLTLE